jgi:hypothetical protein
MRVKRLVCDVKWLQMKTRIHFLKAQLEEQNNETRKFQKRTRFVSVWSTSTALGRGAAAGAAAAGLGCEAALSCHSSKGAVNTSKN